MDSLLKGCIDKLTQQNEILGRARDKYLAKESERKHFEATLIKSADGKSHADRTVEAQATEDWLVFHKELAKLESIFEFQKLKFEILDKEYLAEYATYKIEERVMRGGA